MPRPLPLFSLLAALLCACPALSVRAEVPIVSAGASVIVDRSSDEVEDAVFTASVENELSVTWQWYKDNKPIPGATADTFTVPAPNVARAGRYSVVATHEGDRASAFCDLVVITRHTEKELILNEGAPMKLTASGVYGPALLTWVKDGNYLARTFDGMRGTSSLTLTGPATAGAWELRVATASGASLSYAAFYNVIVRPKPTLVRGATTDQTLQLLESWGLPMSDLFAYPYESSQLFTATGLPPGLTFQDYGPNTVIDPFTQRQKWWLIGVPTRPGIYHPLITVRCPGGTASVRLTLRVAPLPLGMAGTYSGTIAATPQWPLGGVLRMTLANNGTISGVVRHGTWVNRFVSRFDPEEALRWQPYQRTFPAQWTLPTPGAAPRTFNLRVDVEEPGDGSHFYTLQGNVADATSPTAAEFQVLRLLRETQPRNPALSGRFHLTASEEQEFQIRATAVVTLGTSGAGAARFHLADGTEVAGSGDLVPSPSDSERWALVIHSLLYKNTGSISGYVSSSFDTHFTWTRPSAAKAPSAPYAGRLYPAGFTLELHAFGDRYRAPQPADGPMFFDPSWIAPLEFPGNAQIYFNPVPVSEDYRTSIVQVATNGTCTIPPWSIRDHRNSLTVHSFRLTPATGEFVGEVSIFDLDPNDTSRQVERRVPLRGLMQGNLGTAACVLSTLPALGAPAGTLPPMDFGFMSLAPFNATNP